MLITATQKNTRQAPRKVRIVANAVKNLPLDKALQQLAVIERRSTVVILKTVKQAIANATNNHGFAFSDLELKNIVVTEGPTYKRYRAVSRGRGHGVLKRSSHITVILNAGETAQAKTQPKKQTTAEPVKKADNPDVIAEATDQKNQASAARNRKVTQKAINTKTTRNVRNKSSI